MKTAGTSIEVFLSQICGENDIVTPILPHVEPHVARNFEGRWNPLPEIIANKGRGIGQTLGMLWTRTRFYNHIPARTVRCRIPRSVWQNYFKFCVERNPWDKTLSHYHMVNYRAGGGISFDDYMRRGDFCLNHAMYTDAAGRLIVDRVLKYESLMDELAQVFGHLNVPFNGTLGVNAKSESRTDRRPYRQVIADEHRGIIARAFAAETAMHDYVF